MTNMIDWITTKEASNISGYNTEYLRWLIRAGKIRAQKFGASWQVDRKGILAYMRKAAHAEDKRHGAKVKHTA